MDYASGIVVADLTTSYHMLSVQPLSLNHQSQKVRNPTSGVVAPITNMFTLILMGSLYPLILRAQPANRVVMNLNQDGLDKGGHGLA